MPPRVAAPAMAQLSLLLTTLLLLGTCECVVNPGSVDALKAQLFSSYGNKGTRPGLATPADADDSQCRQPTADVVSVQLYVDRFSAPNTAKQTFSLDGYVRSWWYDHRLRFNGTADGGCVSSITLSREEARQVWRPNFYWEKAVEVKLPGVAQWHGEAKSQFMYVYPDGLVYASLQGSLALHCSMNLTNLPFDTQECEVIWGMYDADDSQVKIQWKPERPAVDGWNTKAGCMNEFIITGLDQTATHTTYGDGAYALNYTSVRAKLHYTRRGAAAITDFFLMAIIFVFISMMGLLIDPAATPARVTLGIVSILVVMSNYIALKRSLPPGAATSWLTSFMVNSLLFNTALFLEMILVSFGMQVSHGIISNNPCKP